MFTIWRKLINVNHLNDYANINLQANLNILNKNKNKMYDQK
jgi:hypothetical protein